MSYEKSSNNFLSSRVFCRTSPLKFKNRFSPQSEFNHSLKRSPRMLERNGAYTSSIIERKGDKIRMRRTASLDAIFFKGSLKDFEPRISLLIDKSTQTPNEWDSCCLSDLASDSLLPNVGCLTPDSSGYCPYNSSYCSNGSSFSTPNKRPSRSVSSSPWPAPGVPTSMSDNIEKFIRHRLQKTNKEGVGTTGARYSPVPGDHSVIKPYTGVQTIFSPTPYEMNGGGVGRSASVPQITKPLMLSRFRNSVEELNQEIERLNLKPPSHLSDDEDDWYLQDGRRAPISEYFRSRRSVNTQTPARQTGSGTSGNLSNRSSPASLTASPTLSPPPVQVTTPPDSPSRVKRPERLQMSPHINKFITKEPPDGCERVALKYYQNNAVPVSTTWSPCTNPVAVFTLLPSLGSAFCAPGRTILRREQDLHDDSQLLKTGFGSPQRMCEAESAPVQPLTMAKQ